MAPVHFAHSVLIDGGEVASIVLAGATINYGVSRVDEQPQPANAFLTLISADAVPNIGTSYPGFSWGDRIPSGFTVDWTDVYEGGVPRIALGTAVQVNTATPTGFVEAWTDTYDAGFNDTRFTGHITAIDVQPAAVNVTAVTASESLTRNLIDPSGWPAETEFARVTRIISAASTTGQINGTGPTMITANTGTDPAQSAWTLLSDLAMACDSILYTDRLGVLTYTCRDAAPGTTTDLATGATLLDGLTMTTDFGSVVNTVTVEWGPDDARAKVTATDTESVAIYGAREVNYSVPFQSVTDATDKANRVLDHAKNPVWHMPSATVAMRLAELHGPFPSYLQEVLGIDLDDTVNLPQLLPGYPMESYTSRVLGYRETLDLTNWTIAFALNPAGWTKP